MNLAAGSIEVENQTPESLGSLLFSWTVFPVALCGSVGLSIHMLGLGHTINVATIAGLGFGYLVVILGERLYPFVPAWNRNHADFGTDAAWAGTGFVSAPLFAPIYALLGAGLGGLLSIEWQSSLWPNQWPLIGQLILALVVVEFFQYWLHRLEHETDWLWRFHATHHSAPRLYWLNAARFHIVDILLLGLGFAVPLIALGAPPEIFGLWVVVATIHGLSQHANMQIRCGPLNWIFSMAELHRWHHSPLTEESNANYGQNLIVWDIVFRTRFLPRDRQPPKAVGIADLPGFPMTWWAQLCSPWQWQRTKTGHDGGS
jgi:sterol desaturase/sphingolipid hydroxylase (fatty acid hydroxylase superfamily)